MMEDERKRNLLVLDDDEAVAWAIRRALRGSPFEVRCACDGPHALAVLESRDVDIVLADYRMPDMDGLRFLSIVAERFPRVRRILLTAYGGRQVEVDAFGRARAHRLMTKPWDPEQLRGALEREAGVCADEGPGPVIVVHDDPERLISLAELVRECGCRVVPLSPVHPPQERIPELRPSGIVALFVGPRPDPVPLLRAAMRPPEVPVVLVIPQGTSSSVLEACPPDVRPFVARSVDVLIEPCVVDELASLVKSRFLAPSRGERASP
ncbi:MAG: response regulator [Planctomycetes bacterium]|nr:response regulator [Planctomycetota bacterium]